MASARLRKLAGVFLSEYKLSQRQSSALIGSRTFASKSRSLETDVSDTKSDVPLKFTGSKAQSLKARYTRSGNYNHDELWYQPYVIVISLSTFMIYFFILREESDIDQKFDKTLYDHIEGLEERQIEQALDFNRKNGIDTKALEARLKELRGE